MAMTGAGQGRAQPGGGDQAVLPQGRGVGAAAVRRRAAHRRRPDRHRGRAGHRRGRPPAAQGHRRGLRARHRAAWCSAPAGCARATATWCGWSSDGEGLARQTGLLDERGRPVRGLPPQVVAGARLRLRGGLARRVPGPRLADRARPVDARSRSPAPGRRPRWPWSARPAGWASRAKAREVRGVDRVVIRDGDAIAALLTRLGAHDSCWPGRSAGCAARSGRPPTGWPTSTTPTCAARPAPRSRPAPGSSGRWRSSATTPPTTCRGRPAADRAPAGLAWRSWASWPTRR